MLILVWQCSSTLLVSALSIRGFTSVSSFIRPVTCMLNSSIMYLSRATLPCTRSIVPSFSLSLSSLQALWVAASSSLLPFNITFKVMPLVSSQILKVKIIKPVLVSCSTKVCKPPSLSKVLTSLPSMTTLSSSSVIESILRTCPLIVFPHKRPVSFFCPYRAS